MFRYLFLLALAGPNLAPGVSGAYAESKLIQKELTPIASENCQATPLRKFHLRELEGVKVHILIYGKVENALTKARAAGNPLGLTSTFRTCAEQNTLRASNCGSISSEANSCNPATEKAGESLHNYGLAVDFKCDGYPVFGNSPCYSWLKNNQQGLKQRSDEPWHWSLTGH